MLIISVLIYLLLSMLLSLRVFGKITFSRLVVFFLLVTSSLNILVAELLSVLNSLDQAWFFLLIQVVVSLVVGILLWDPRKRIFPQPLSTFKFEVHKPLGLDWLLIGLISVILLLAIYLGSLVPINNSDSLQTHLPRIYYWIQHGSLASWDAVIVTQINKPINLSLQGLWLFLLGGSEMLFFLATWYALLTVVVLVSNIASQLGASYRGSLLAALISLSFPVLLLQTFSYQGDVFVATLALAGVAFLLEYLREKRQVFLLLSLLPMAVALGVKNTSFFILPFYLLIVFIQLIRERVKLKRYLVIAGVFLLLFGIFSSLKFVQNYIERDQLKSSMFATQRYLNPKGKVDPIRRAATNTMRYLYQGLSIDGMTGQLKLSAENLRANAFRSLSERLGLDLETKKYISRGDTEEFQYTGLTTLNEDTAWFGPLCLILFPIATGIILFGREKNRKKYLLVSLVFLLSVFLMIGVLITGWSPTNGRYLMLPMIVFSPLFAFIHPERWKGGWIITVVVSIAAAGLAFSTLLMNDSNPLVTKNTLYHFQSHKLNRSEDAGFISHAYTYFCDRVIEDLVLTAPGREDIKHQSYYENLLHQNSGDIPDIEFVNTNVAASERLHLFIRRNLLEYALFGINRTRDLVPVKSLEQVPTGDLVLVESRLVSEFPGGFNLVASNDHFLLLRKN